MDYLIYDQKRKQWGAVLQKQKIKDKVFYQINFDNNLKKEDESSVNFYTKDLKKVTFEYLIYYELRDDEFSIDSVSSNKFYHSPKEAHKALNDHIKELRAKGFSIVTTQIETIDIDTTI